MLKEFLERNPSYRVQKRQISVRTYELMFYNLDTCEMVQTTGILVPLLHKKFKDKLKDGVYGRYLKQTYPTTMLIEGEIYELNENKLTQLSGGIRPVLVQQLKTKTKVIASGYNDISSFVRLLVINGNMKGTREKKREDRPLNKHIRPSDVGYRLTVFNNWNGRKYLSVGGHDDSITYDIPKNELRTLMQTHHVKVDENYHTVVELPKQINEENIIKANQALLFEFGTRNNAPIFRIELQATPELKGEKIC